MKSSIWILLCLGFLVTACNEEVAPDLDAVSASTDPAGPIVPPSEYIFKVENTSPSMLGYNLHRTGSGKSYAECKISSAAALTGADYEAEGILARDHDTKNYDYSCILEAEELNLYFSGVSFKVTASKNTCEYIGYSPFSYYAWQPGNSTKTVISKKGSEGANCITTPDVDIAGGGKLGCGTEGSALMADQTVPAGSRLALTEDTLCAFDYTAVGGPNCDPGIITINEYSYQYDEDSGATEITGPTPRKKSCGGKIVNCISGPIKEEPRLSAATNGTILYQTVRNQEFSSEYTFKGGIEEQRGNNLYLANWRRDLAAFDIDYVTSQVDYNIAGDVYTLNAFFDNLAFANKKNYNPRVMELYSVGRDGTGAVNADLTTALTTASTRLGHTAIPLAADPFLGYGAGNRTNPHYTFFCLDEAFEVKARIRMSIREWDRVFYPDPTGVLDNFALISDIDKSDTMARMDNPTGTESDIDFNSYNHYNDLGDWDDFLPMERNDVTLKWEPVSGYFAVENFPLD